MRQAHWLPSTVLALALASCATTRTPDHQVARVEVAPGAFLFTQAGQKHKLAAKALDASGKGVQQALTWTSNNPGVVSVSPDGTIEAHGQVGSAQIRAIAGSVRSDPVVVLLAQPVSGAVLYSREQVISGPNLQPKTVSGRTRPTAITNSPFEVGDQYAVTLTSMQAPQVGSVLVPQDDSQYAGRIVSVAPSGNDLHVVLEVVPLTDVFQNLAIDETMELDGSFSQSFNLGGVATSSLRHSASAKRLPDGRVATTFVLPVNEDETSTFLKIPPLLKCTAVTNGTDIANLFAPSVFSVNVTAPVTAEVNLRAGAETKFKVGFNSVTAVVTGGIKFAPNVSGSINCQVGKQIPVPMGPVSAIIMPLFPIGFSLSFSGDITVNTFEADIVGQVKSLGPTFLSLDCPATGSCGFSGTVAEFDKTVSPKTVFPGDQNFRFTGALNAGGFAGLSAGNKMLDYLEDYLSVKSEVNLLNFTAGFRQDLLLGTISDQAANADFAANYKLGFQETVSLGSDVQKVIKLIFGSVRAVSFSFTPVSIPISASPTGGVIALEDSYQAGDTVHFTVSLDPDNLTYLGVYNVDEVRLYRKRQDGSLEPQPVATQPAGRGQSTFDLAWQAADSGTTDGKFVAFVVTHFLPFAPLKLGTVTSGSCSGQPLGLRTLSDQCIDFSGTWVGTAVDTSPCCASDPPAVFPVTVVIAQNGNEVRFKYLGDPFRGTISGNSFRAILVNSDGSTDPNHTIEASLAGNHLTGLEIEDIADPDGDQTTFALTRSP